jgi:hypothetical protein
VGDNNSPEESKQFVVGIPYASQGCGRASTHISFVDNLNRNSVGALFEYGVRAVQVIGNTTMSTAMTTSTYRIPFFIQVGVTIKNPAGKGIFNVTVSFCHIDPDTGENDLDPLFCPVLVVTTDKRGLAVGTIRVSSPSWVYQMEQFNVTASFVERIITGQIVVHEFSPSSQILTFSHTLGVGSVSITDVTKIKIYGQVLFDPKLLGGVSCPFANVPVNFLDFSGTSTNSTSGADGRFNFTAGYREFASLYIPEYLGNTWRVSMITWKNYYYQTESNSPTSAPVGMKSQASLASISNMKVAKALLSTSRAAEGRQFSIQSTTDLPSSKPTPIPSYEITELPTVQYVPQVQGLMFKVYKGYFNDDSKFFAREFEYAIGYSDDFSSITSASNGYLAAGSGQSLISIEWFGYILTPPGTTGVWTISLTSDDSSLLWLGDSALTSYTISNSLIINKGVHSVTTKVASKYLTENSSYPIRIQYGQFIDDYQLGLKLTTPQGLTSTGSGFFFSSPAPTAAPSAAPTFEPSAVAIVGSGLYFRVFQGYFGDDINFFSLHASYAEGFSSDLSSVSTASKGYLVETNTQVLVSIEWFGYLQIPTDSGGVWNFTLSSDDSSIMWLGDNAVSDYTTSNAFISNIGVHSLRPMRNSMILMESVYYPIRIQYGQYRDDYNLILTATSPIGELFHGDGIFFTGAVPTMIPSGTPSKISTIRPSTLAPTIPTKAPSKGPSVSPSRYPTTAPPSRTPLSIVPSTDPSVSPSRYPTTALPSRTPSSIVPLTDPSISPSRYPTTALPSRTPSSIVPSTDPSISPSRYPTIAPVSRTPSSIVPSKDPSISPSRYSTIAPVSRTPSSIVPSKDPSISPSRYSTIAPVSRTPSSIVPSKDPSVSPSRYPTYVRSSRIPSSKTTKSPSKGRSIAAKVLVQSSSKADALPSHLFTDSASTKSTLTYPPTETPPSSFPSSLASDSPTATPSFSASYSPTFITSSIPSSEPHTTIPSVEPSSQIYAGLLFTLQTGLTNSSAGYAQRFGSLLSATENSIRNFSFTNVSVQWTGYLLTPVGSTGSWTFWSLSDGAVEVWINGMQIIKIGANLSLPLHTNDSNSHYSSLTNATTLQSNTYYPIRISYKSDSPQKLFQLFFTSPISKISSDFSTYFYYCAQRLVVSTTSPSIMATVEPTFKPSNKPVTARPSRVPTAEPTMSSSSIRGLLFNVYSLYFNQDPKFFSSNVPYLAGFTTDLSSLSNSVTNQVLLQGEISVEWFGYLSTQSSGDGPWSFTILSDSPGYFWIGKNAASGYTARNAFSFGQTNSGPFTVTLFKGTYVPIRIQVGSASLSSFSSFSFKFTPPGSRSLSDGYLYFISTRPADISVDETVMMHEYFFDKAELKGNILTDVVGSLPAYLSPTVSLKNGKAVFDDPSKPQYIQLHPSILLSSNSFSIELWVEFNVGNNPSSTLFSFGPTSENIHFNASFKKAVYVAVVYSSNSSSVYVDGILTKNSSFSYNGFPAESIMGYNFIGRNALGSGPGMSASIDAIRIWYGELSAGEIFSNHIAGYKSSSLLISEDLSLTDINVTYYATTIQTIKVGFFGGNTSLSPMFGPETTFLLSASDPQCPYSTIATLDANTSTAMVSLSAMNYSVTIQSAPPGAPLYESNVCDLKYPTTSCFCTASKPALQYLEDANRTTQNILITTANATVYHVTYIYESGICFQVVGSSTFSLTEGDTSTSNNIEYSCFKSSGAFVAKGSNTTVGISIFSRYPYGASWIGSYGTPISRMDGAVFDNNISNSLVYINDQVSGAFKTTFEYNSSAGLSYTITAGFPRPSAPFSWLFSVLVTNNGLDGTASAIANWYLVVLGVIPKEVPNFYPVATNPDMIFLVLRDPPGGASSVTIAAGIL